MALKDQIIAELQKKTTEQASSLAELKQQLAEEAEVHELELEELRLQKDEVVQQMMNAAQVEEEDPLADLGLEEIRAQNRKLRSAITNLTFGFEEEKKKLDQQAKQVAAKGAKVKTLQGGELVTRGSDEGVSDTGAKVAVADLDCTNGVIHVIDKVLLPQ